MQIGLGIGTTFRQRWNPLLTEQIRSLLFGSGEQGAWYDPSDLSTMYQDAGSTPVYMPGQGQVDPPVGLRLDKRLGLTRGPELWVDARVQFIGESSRVAPGVYRVYSSAGAWSAVQLSGLIAGEWYELSLNVDSITTLGNGLICDVTTPVVILNSVGPKKYLLRTNNTTIAIKRNPSAPTDIQISSVSVRRILGNHAYQTTTTSRPTLSARYNLLTNTSFAGASAGVPGTAPTEWWFGIATGRVSAVTPLGPDFAIQITTSANRLFLAQKPTAAPNVTYSHGIDVLETTGITAINLIALTDQPLGSTVTYYFNGELITISTVISSPGRLEMRMTVGSTGGPYYVRFGVGCSGNTTGVATIARPDIRVTDNGVGLPPYQRVADAKTYDTVGFPIYINGVDDSLTSSTGGGGTTGFFFSAAISPQGSAGTARTLFSDAGANTGYIVRLNASNQLELSAGNGTAYTTISTAGALNVGATDVVQAWDDGTNLNVKIGTGPTASIVRPVVSAGTAGYTLYQDNGASTRYFNGRRYGEIYRKNSGLTQSQREAVVVYQRQKARIA